MEFHVIGKKYSQFGIWEKCFLHVSNNEIKFQNIRSKLNEQTIIITPNTKFDFKEKNGRTHILIKDNTMSAKFQCKKNIYDCMIALKSTKQINANLQLDDFIILSKLSEGFFGKISLVQHRLSQKIYALKQMSKSHLYKTNSIKTAFNEKTILEKIYNNNPYLVKMEFAFQNSTDYFIGLEYIPGGDMRTLLDNVHQIKKRDLRIYIAEIAICIKHLHDQKILYRDLKPENILISLDGHIKLTDFGLAKDITYNDSSSTSTFCGTLCYLPPELIKHNKYSYESDWYQLGILAYELYYGDVPFDDQNRNKTMEKIINEKPMFPKDTDQVLVDLIENLIEKDPSKRFNFEKLQKHKFFQNFSFKDIEEKKISPSFIPKILHPADTRYFYPIYDYNSSENDIYMNEYNIFNEFSFVSNEFNKCF